MSIYLEYLRMWHSAGGDLFIHFTDVTMPTKFGSWGSLEHIQQDAAQAPKFQALMEYIDEIIK